MADLKRTSPKGAVPTLASPEGYALAEAYQIAVGNKDVAQVLAEIMSDIGAEASLRTEGDQPDAVNVNSSADYERDLAAQLNEDSPKWFVVTADISGTYDGNAYSYAASDVLYIPPRSDAVEFMWNLGSGGTGVSPTQLAAEVARRTDGDRPSVYENINSTGTLQIALNLQANRDRPAYFVAEDNIIGVVNGETVRLAQGYVGLIPPRTNRPQDIRTILNPAIWMYLAGGHWGKLDVTPGNIKAAADLDGSYQITLSDLPVKRLQALRVNYLEIWFEDEAIHVVSPWSPVETDVITAVIDASEETQIGLTNQDNIRVLAVFRYNEGGGQAYRGQVGGLLTIGGKDTAGESLSFQSKIELSGYRLSPQSVSGNDAEDVEGTYSLAFQNAGVLSDSFVEVAAQGQSILARQAWSASNPTIRATISSSVATGIVDNLTDSSFPIEYSWYDAASGGTLLGTLKIQVQVNAGGSGGQDDTARREARAAQAAADTADGKADAAGTLAAQADGKADTNAAGIKANKDDITSLEGHSSLATKQLLGREAAASDFRGSYTRWRGAVADRTARFALSSPANGDVCFQVDENRFYARASGGWSPIEANHTPAAWAYYATFAAAVAAETAPNRFVIWSDGSLFSTIVGTPVTLHYFEVANEAAYDALSMKPNNILFGWSE